MKARATGMHAAAVSARDWPQFPMVLMRGGLDEYLCTCRVGNLVNNNVTAVCKSDSVPAKSPPLVEAQSSSTASSSGCKPKDPNGWEVGVRG